MEIHPVAHPSDYILKAFEAGKLDDAGRQAVLAHLEVCLACRARANLSSDRFGERPQAARPVEATAANADGLGDTRGGNAVPEANETAGSVPTTLFNVPPELADHPDYELLGELGRGGMGVVYLAKHRLSGRKEVLKVMNKALIGQAESKERFLREIQSAARLDHKNVVKMHTALERGELMVLVMEYVPGEDLAQVVKGSGPLPVPNACYYVQQAAAGLQHAFEKGMIHRDIKPQNLILARAGKKHTVKVLDFGLAKATRGEDVDAGLTGTGILMGTPGYVAPEQSLDAASVDIRADIYSLGCTLYYLMAGKPPFSGRSAFEIVQAHHATEAKPLNLVRSEVPEALASVVRKMMAKEASQRYQTPREVVQALEPFVKGILKPLMPQVAPSKGEQPDTELPPVIRATRIEGPATIARARMNPSPRKSAPPKGGQPDDAPSLSRETMIEGDAAIARTMETVGPPRSRKTLAAALAVLLLLAGLAGLCVFLVLRLSTPEGILVQPPPPVAGMTGNVPPPSPSEKESENGPSAPKEKESEKPPPKAPSDSSRSPDLTAGLALSDDDAELKRLTSFGSKAEIRKWLADRAPTRLPAWREAAGRGSAEGMFLFAWCLIEGIELAKNEEEAVKWLRKAAEQDHAEAQRQLGFMYVGGHGVSRDSAEAVKWYRKAAEQGHVRAQSSLGYAYLNGSGVSQDYAEALKWYRKAAEQGYSPAQYNLGFMYEHGRGAVRNYAEALKWYRKAAEQGHATAQGQLGFMYDKGLGVTQNYAEALKWYRKAAENGHATAQNNLGFMYHWGLGVAKNYAEALKW